MPEKFHFYDESALLDRLSKGLKRRPQETVFLVGAPLSAPYKSSLPGVPGVDGVIELIRAEFVDDRVQLAALERTLSDAGDNRYQAAFLFLQGRRGQQTANEIVRSAVLSARAADKSNTEPRLGAQTLTDDRCRILELDESIWYLSPGTASMGQLAVDYPNLFGKHILTTNFDPLIEISIRRAGGSYLRTILHSDGNLSQTEGSGAHVIHLHGYWHGSDTLHTTRQLGQPRPRLRASLTSLLRSKLVVVCAYGGWDDAFTEAMMDVVRDDNAYPEILWTFHDEHPKITDQLANRLQPGIDRGRVTLYSGIDCHHFFPQLHAIWRETTPAQRGSQRQPSNPVRVDESLIQEIQSRAFDQSVVEGDDEDRPPVVDICVGREAELALLKQSPAKVIFLTGVGGQGKSTLAAQFYNNSQQEHAFSLYIWRDCKEETERFENQLASVIEKLAKGKLSGEDLAAQTPSSLVEILFQFIRDVPALFVFDNVDHHVDLETQQLTATPAIFIQALLQPGVKSRAVFTCRPTISYGDPLVLCSGLTGIDLQAALKLFSKRGAPSSQEEIEQAHSLTEGHAFWLDLMAIQAARQGADIRLTSLLNEIRSGRGPLPENTLQSIWTTLRERERIVLRAMAETVKPESETDIADYVSGHGINYAKVIKALKTLRALNLVVVKHRPQLSDLVELHPMVRQFIRQNFTRTEQQSFVAAIIRVYQRYIARHKSQLAERPGLSLLQYWTQNAELDIAAGKTPEAFQALGEVADAFASSAYPREFCRVARLLLSHSNWIEDHAKYKDFEVVFKSHTRLLGNLGENQDVDALLVEYAKTVPVKSARYINYCELRCHAHWIRGEFAEAVRWGEDGRNLKASGVDTKFDVSHALALAQRDSGRPDAALPFFLAGRRLTEVTDPDELDTTKGGPHYGNIGRCLHMMGQVEDALVCYQKSALLIERAATYEHVVNQGFIRAWVGELLMARGQFRLSEVFLEAARMKWRNSAPPRAEKVAKLAESVRAKIRQSPNVSDDDAEEICLKWIFGRNLDPIYA